MCDISVRFYHTDVPLKLVASAKAAKLCGKRTNCRFMVRCYSCILHCPLVVWCTLVPRGCVAWRETFSCDHDKMKRTCDDANVCVDRPQFIVGEDGTCGLVYEHSPAEGPPIVFLIDYVVKYM